MFKNKIAFKLTTGFVVIVLLSMLIIGIFFIQMFRQYTIDTRKNTMIETAYNISEAISENSQNDAQTRGFGGFIRFLDTITESKVWITDNTGNPAVITGMGMDGGMRVGPPRSFSSEPLPVDAQEVIRVVLSGKESISESFSSVYKESTITVGVPIYNPDNKVIGAVLMHSPVTGINEALNKAIVILIISILAALLLAIGLGISYSMLFTRPLKAMNNTAIEMSHGNYSARTGVNRDDEIGQLGNSLDLLASKLGYTIDKLERLEQLRKDYVANVSHEFRTPLTVIKGSLEALIDGTVDKPEDIDRYHQRMLIETRSLERLVGDLMELSRLQSGKISINKEEVHIPNLLSDIAKSLQSIATKKQIQIECTVIGSIPPVIGDYDRLRQLFIIFIDNAIKYSPDKTIVTVKISIGNTLEVSIQDQGYGISEKELPYIWDRFFKADKSRKSNGTGLGLAIAKHLVHLHGGNVSLQSTVGEGTTVLIKLPIKV